MRSIRIAFLSLGLMMNPHAHGDTPRLACTLLAKADLVSLLGADHDAPVNFGEDSCRVESRSPGRNVFLSLSEQTETEISNWLTMTRLLNLQHRSDEVDVVAEPSLGINAFSVRAKGPEAREFEIYAAVGSQAMTLNASFATGTPIMGTDITRLLQLARTIVAELP